MKNTFLLLSFMALVVGCDSPQRTRLATNGVNGNGLTYPSTTTGGTFTTSPTTGLPTGTTPTNTLGAGFESCDLSDKYQTIDIGFFGLCQSTQDELTFKFRTSLTSTSVRTCLIPIYKESSGSSTWIGQPQCTYTTAGQVVTGKLYKDRTGFTTYPVNGVIVMKEPLLPEYFACMQGYTGWPANLCATTGASAYCNYWGQMCPYGAKTNTQCDAEGRSYMNKICTDFKTKYTNSYIDIRTKN
jgi:hypothetical protein